MRRKILSKVLAAVLSVAIIVPSLVGGFVASAANETTITDTFDSGAGNWGTWIGEGVLDTSEAGYIGLPKTTTTSPTFFGLNAYPDLPIKSVTFNLSAKLQGAANILVGIVYYYEDDDNYKTIGLRETGSSLIYHAPISGKSSFGNSDVVGTTLSEDVLTVDGQSPVRNAGTNYKSDLQNGGSIILTYTKDIIYVTVKNSAETGDGYQFRITSSDPELDFTKTKGIGLVHCGQTGNGATESWVKLDSANFTFDGQLTETDPQDDADAFRTAHADILKKTTETVTISDEAAVDAALTAYEALSVDVKELLASEKTLLDALKAKISEESQSTDGYYLENFESGNGAWVSLNDPAADGWGSIDNPDKNGINTSEKVFNPAYSTAFDARYALSDEMWEKMEGKKLASVTADVHIEGATWGHELKIYYYYKDENNYKAIQLMRETKGLPNVYNNRDAGAVYTFAKELVSSTEGVYTADRAQISYFTVPTDVKWLKLSFIYNEDNTITLTLRDDTTVYSSVVIEQNAMGQGYEEVVELNSQKIAFGRDTGASTAADRQNYIDNISVNFVGSAPDEAERWIQKNLDAITVDAERIVPEQKAMIETALAEYERLSTGAQAFAANEKAKLDVLKAAGDAWDGDIAESFRNIYADALRDGAEREDLEAAWNVLRRLPVSEQETLANEKGILESALEAMAGSGTKNPIDIACIGDSLTYGQGATAQTSWPGVLQTLLGETFKVRNNGVSGFRVIREYEAKDGKLQYELSGSAAWSEILLAQPDVIIIMLGTNDSVIENPNDDAEWKAEKQQMFKDGLEKMIRIFQSMPSSPTILFATSPTRYIRTGTGYEATDKANWEKQKVIYELQLEVIEELGLPYVDIYDISEKWTDEEKTQYFNTNDALHFTAAGYEQFANEIYAYFEENFNIGFQTDNGGLTYTYFETKSEEPSTPAVTSVNISPSPSTVHVGKTQTFAATVSGTGDYNKNVTWSVSGNESTNTKIENGTLTVGEDETAETLTITATSVGDSAKSATATVTVEPHDFTGDYKSDEKKHWKECKCGAIAEEADHVMGAWAIAGDNHTRSCVCGKTETESHEYGDWTKVDENQHKRICSVCNAVDKQNHVGADEWQCGPEGHWHECEVCGMLEDAKIAHTPGPEATETTPQTCTVCDYIIAPALGHTHEAEEAWQHDETQHWHECTGCEEKLETADHDYGDWKIVKEATETEVGSRERTCTACDYVQTEVIPVLEHNHVYGEEWKSDGTGHWHVCACGEMDEVAAHTYGEWKVTKEATTTEPGSRERICSVCGYTQVEPVPVKTSDVVIEVNTEEKMEGTAPKTGDVFPVALFVTLLLASAAVGTVLVMKKYKRA